MTGGIPSYEILRAVEDILKPLAAAHKGLVVIAHDPAEALWLLHNAPEQWRIIVALDTEDTAEQEPAYIGASRTRILTMVQRPVGMAADPSKLIHRGAADGSPSILEYAEAVRGWMRGIKLEHEAIDCQITFSWQGSEWVSVQKDDTGPLRFARQHNFIILHNIELPVALDPVTLITT